MGPNRILALVSGLALAIGSAQAKPRERATPLSDPEPAAAPDTPSVGLEDAPPEGDAPPEKKKPAPGPNWGAKPVRAGKVEAVGNGGAAGIGLAKVTGLKGIQDDERLYVLSSDYNGVVAELTPRKVNKKRTQAQCEIETLRPKFARSELVGKPVVHEADLRGYLKRFNVGAIAGGGGGGGGNGGVSQDKNPLAMVAFLSEGFRSAAFDVMTGASLRQEVETVGGEVQFFLPAPEPDSVLNWFGLRAVFTKSQKGELVGRYPDASEVMRFKIDGTSQKLQLAVRPTFARVIPAQAWFLVTLSEARTDKLKTADATALGAPGALTLESSTKGSGIVLGGALMPFDGFTIGLGAALPLSQQLTVKERSGNGETTANGTWTRLDLESYGGVRFPRPAGSGGGMAFEFKGGLTYRKDTVKLKDEGTTKGFADIVKWVTFGVGYVP